MACGGPQTSRAATLSGTAAACLLGLWVACSSTLSTPAIEERRPATTRDAALRVLDGAIHRLAEPSADFRSVLRDAEGALPAGTDERASAEIGAFLARAPQPGPEFHCSVDFLRVRARRTLMRLREVLLNEAPPPLEPAVCYADPFALDARMRAVLRAMRRIDWQVGRLLRVFLDRRLYRLMLFPSAHRYVTERLGLSARKARALVALERKTWDADTFGAAYRTGELSWVRALTILPVVTERTAAAWVERAAAVPVRRLADEVEWALAVRDGLVPIAPPPAGAALVLDERQLCARPGWEFPDAEVAFSAPVAVVALVRTAILAFAHPRDSLIGGLESLLLHVKAEWEGQPRHRDPIFARDGWRCAVPVCTARQQLHDHHLVFRSRGGGNERENRITLCAWHHLRGVHAGRVRAEGEAPDGITWEIGVRPRRRPLLRLVGERYATG